MQAKSGSSLVNELCQLRENYIEVASKIKDNPIGKIDMRNFQRTLPHSCIITQSDKNVGVSILPYEWYMKEYEVHIQKGGHEAVHISENQCLAMLNKVVEDFKNNCTPTQRKILIQHWPKTADASQKIGVLKLLPKVRYIFFKDAFYLIPF